MSDNLGKIIHSIVTSPKEEFLSSLKECLEQRLDQKISEKYDYMLNNILVEPLVEAPKPIKESVEVKKENIGDFLTSLKESYFEDKTIIHKFRDGNTVAITPEDSASLIKMHDNLNIMNQERMRNLMSESFIEYNKILRFSKNTLKG